MSVLILLLVLIGAVPTQRSMLISNVVKSYELFLKTVLEYLLIYSTEIELIYWNCLEAIYYRIELVQCSFKN